MVYMGFVKTKNAIWSGPCADGQMGFTDTLIKLTILEKVQ